MTDMAPLDAVGFIQARMSSSRFPGKVLAPFRGEPLIDHVVAAVETVLPGRVVVVTSDRPSDEPLVAYLERRGIPTCRGPLGDVFGRFRSCLRRHPAEYVLRISGDSPLHDPDILERVLGEGAALRPDLVTTVFPRTFPSGRNAELIRAELFEAVDPDELGPDDREHVTPYFYRNQERYQIVNVAFEAGRDRAAPKGFAVDTVEDLRRLESGGGS